MTAPLVRVGPEHHHVDSDDHLDEICAEMSARGYRWIGTETGRTASGRRPILWAAFVPCTAVRGADRFYYVDGRPFTVDAITWTARDIATVTWWWDDDARQTVHRCSVIVGGCGTDVTPYGDGCGTPDHVIPAIERRVLDAYPEHLHEWTY